MRRQFFEQRQLRLVMIAAPAEPQQPEHAERQRQWQRVPRVLQGVSAHDRQCVAGGAVDRQRDRVDVPALARGNAVREPPSAPRRCLDGYSPRPPLAKTCRDRGLDGWRKTGPSRREYCNGYEERLPS